LLFARVNVLGVAWLRIASAAVVFACWKRPWRLFAELGAGEKRIVVALGFVLAIMNVCFYLAIDRLPLATVGTIEFLGPIVLAALPVFVPLSSRTSAINLQWRDYRRLLLLLCYRFCLPQRAW